MYMGIVVRCIHGRYKHCTRWICLVVDLPFKNYIDDIITRCIWGYDQPPVDHFSGNRYINKGEGGKLL